ncbi:conserved hypothetical protein [[Clostridium] ultunense Esp]|nr:conserved hypothetical protein [[Clostridium] ultunense Esp]
MNLEPIIKTVSLHKVYDSGGNQTIAVQDVTLEVAEGTSVAITGPSGCGKTTLLNLIGFVTPPTSGELWIENEAASLITEKKRAQYRNRFFGYVVQDFALVDDYSVYENVEIPLLYAHPRLNKKERRRRVEEMLDKVGLLEKRKEEIANLSGGQKQRVAIARALVNQPRVILADEPTGSLDSRTSEEIFSLLMGLVKEGKTLLMVTHNPELARRCDREVKMLDGRILSSGASNQGERG